MAESLATLALRLTAKDDASSAVNAMGAKIKAELSSIGTVAAGLVFGNLATNLTLGVAERLKTAAEAFDVFGNSVAGIQRLTGESAESASLLLGALTRYGTTSETASLSIIKLQRSIAGLEDPIDIVQAGGKSGTQQLKELGIQATDSAGHVRTASDVFLQLADVVKNKSADEQISLISTIFKIRGNEAAGLQRVLNQGSAAIQEYFGLLKATGNTFDQQQVDDVLAFTKAHQHLDLALQGVSRQMGSAFAPSLDSAAQKISDLTVAIGTDLIPLIKGMPGWIIPAAASVVGLSIGYQLLAAAAKFVFAPVVSLAGAITAEGAVATVAAGENADLAIAETAVGVEAEAAAPKVGLLTRAAATAGAGFTALMGTAAGTFAVLGAAIYTFSQPLLEGLRTLHDLRTEMDKLPVDKLNPLQKSVIDFIHALPDIDPSKFDIGAMLTPKLTAAAEDQAKQTAPSVDTETAAEKRAKAAKADANSALKAVQDAAAQRKDTFDLGNIENNRAALTAKLDEAQANAALLPLKRQLEDLDRNAIDFAHQRLLISQDEAAVVAKIGETKLKNAADDLSYTEKLLLAQARAAKMRGEDVDMSALRAKVLAIRQQQIQDEPGLLIAGHTTALADRAVQATSMSDTLTKDALERNKIALKEQMQPLEDELVLRTRLAESAQKILDLSKLDFEIRETFYAKDLLLAQIAGKAADESYQKAVAAATAAGIAPGTAPLPSGVASSGNGGGGDTVINQTNTFNGVDTNTAEAIANQATDKTLEALRAAQIQSSTPARRTLPGAFSMPHN